MIKRLTALGIALLIFSAVSVEAVTPRSWELLRLEQFLKGKFEGISVSYAGILSLAPREVAWQGPLEEFYLCALRDRDGNLFLGTGHSGNIYKVDQEGKAELYFHAPEMDVYCMALDSRGILYAGTSPNGKIYKITAPLTVGSEPFFDPEERYIWDLEFMDDDILLAAVGESGAVYTISPQGDGSEWLKAKENHILCLTKTPQGDILAGSGGKGRLYRLSRGKAPAILYDSPFEEIRAIVLDDQEAIYMAAGGKVVRPASKAPVTPAGASVATDVAITVTPEGVAPSEPETGGLKQPGALFRIGPDGMARKIWSSDEDIIYTLLWDNLRKRIVFGTGNRGRIYAVDRDEEKVSLLLQKESEQVFTLLKGDSLIYSLANNPPALSLLYPDQRDRGEYTSEVFDAGLVSSWGRIEWDAALPRGTTIQLQTRSGNSDQPGTTWSNWSPPYGNSPGEQILNPAARYLQFKILFKTDSGRISPEIGKVSLFYQQTNVAPVISMLEILPVNTIFLESPPQNDPILGLNPGPAAKAAAQKGASSVAMAKKTERKGYQTVVWEARDENGDHLLYDLSIKERQGDDWRVLKSSVTQKVFAFETLSMPDGEYELRLEAHDGPSNPAGRELRTEKTSRHFVIDNSLPVVSGFEAIRSGSRLTLQFSAQDSFSRIKEVWYLIRPDEWRIVFPADGICDSRQERFEVRLTLPSDADNMVTVKVVDEHGNVGVHRAEF